MAEEALGLKTNPNPGRDLDQIFNGKTFRRFPIKTKLIVFDDKLEDVIKTYVVPEYKSGDLFCIASKVVSVTRGYYIHEDKLKVGRVAKFAVKFVKKWPNDPGFAIPKKIQWTIDILGYPRFFYAIVGGLIMKLIGKPGYFYKLAGHNIRSIDGFIPEDYPEPFKKYGFIAPPNCDEICEEIYEKFGMDAVILDGNNVENIVMGMSKSVYEKYSREEIMTILKGNPQGQDGNTPILLVRVVS